MWRMRQRIFPTIATTRTRLVADHAPDLFQIAVKYGAVIVQDIPRKCSVWECRKTPDRLSYYFSPCFVCHSASSPLPFFVLPAARSVSTTRSKEALSICGSNRSLLPFFPAAPSATPRRNRQRVIFRPSFRTTSKTAHQIQLAVFVSEIGRPILVNFLFHFSTSNHAPM